MGNGGAAFYTIQFSDANGVPYSQPKLYHYAAGGGTTDKDIYSDEAKTTPLAQPFVGDTSGRFNFYADGDFRLYIRNNADTLTIFNQDNIRISKDSTGIWEGDHGAAYPTPVSASVGHIFGKITSNILREIGYNADGANYDKILEWDASGDFILSNIKTLGPIANVKHPTYGATGDGVTNDSVAIQAAIDSGYKVIYFPSGTYISKNLTGLDGLMFVGDGDSSLLKFPSSGVTNSDYLLRFTDCSVKLFNLKFDGNAVSATAPILKWVYSAAAKVNSRIQNCHFTNHGYRSIYITGNGSYLKITQCHFNAVEDAVFIDGGGTHISICDNSFVSLTGQPIHLTDSDYASIIGNKINGYEATYAGIALHSSDRCLVLGNIVAGSEAYSIFEGTLANYNIIVNNDVSGGHTNDITLVGAYTICALNQGSDVFQNGQVPSGAVAVSAYNYKSIESTTTDTQTSNGRIKDTTTAFDKEHNVLAHSEGFSHRDYVSFPGISNDMLFPVRSIVDINTLQLGASKIFDSPGTFDAGVDYVVYPNIEDSANWETTAIRTDNLVATVGAPDTASFTGITCEKEFLKVVITADSGDAGNADVKFTWRGLTDVQVADNQTTAGTAEITTFFLLKDSAALDSLSVTLYNASAGSQKIKVEVFALKRSVDA